MTTDINYYGYSAQVEITDPEDHIQKYWKAGAFYESNRNGMLNDLFNRLPNGQGYVDIGAHMGNHTLFFAKVKQADEVHSFEPFPSNRKMLKRNIALNRLEEKVRVYPFAIGNHSEFRNMAAPEGNSGMATFSETGERVQVMRLDDVLKNDRRICCIKIDVEGKPIEVLRGATETIATNRPILYVECAQKTEFYEVEIFLKRAGYKVHPGFFNATPTYLFLP